MTVVETNTIDGMGISKDGKGIALLISDHLEWHNEYEHLLILQDKINNYISFLENKQYKEIYPELDAEYAIIEIHFLYNIPDNCVLFLETVQKQVEPMGITLDVQF